MLKTTPFLVLRACLLIASASSPSAVRAQSPTAAPPSEQPLDPVASELVESWSREVALRQQLTAINGDLRTLRAQDKAVASPYPALKVTLAGAGLGVVSAFIMLYGALFYEFAASDANGLAELPRAMVYTFAACQITGAALTLGGLIALTVRLHQGPNRERVKLLDEERDELRRQIKQERKERHRLERLEPDASFGAQGGSFGVRYAF